MIQNFIENHITDMTCLAILVQQLWHIVFIVEMLKKQNVFIAHCSESNTNLSSGVVTVKMYLDRGMKVGLGSDIAAVHRYLSLKQ